MKLDSTHRINEDWDNVYYDKNDESIDFHNETDSLFIYGISPATFIRAFRNATCAGCNCTKLQEMDLPEHAKDNLREIGMALNAWNNREVEKVIAAQQAEAEEQDRADIDRQGAEIVAAAML